MVIRKTTKTKTNAKKAAAKARSQGFNSTISKKKSGRFAVSVTRKK